MSVNQKPPIAVGKHDINAGLQGPWTIEIPLNPGDSLTGTPTVITVMPGGSDDPLVETTSPLVISSVAIGQISVSPNVWGISFKTQSGTAQVYWLRGAAQRTDGTNAYGVHRTVQMIAGNN
jgi:hypothetical protein